MMFSLCFTRLESCILRQFLPNEDHIDETQTDDLGELSFQNQHVPYSLKKKKRWLLPEKIRSQILDSSDTDDETNIQLAEYHKLHNLKTAKCVRFASSTCKKSKSGLRKIRSKRKERGYFDVSSVTDENKPNTNRNRRTRANTPDFASDGDESDRETREPCQLNYKVIYPSPATSYASHFQKYIHCIPDRWTHWDRPLARRLRTKLSRHIHESVADMYNDESDDDPDDFLYGHSDSDMSKDRITVELHDLLKHGKRISSRMEEIHKSKPKKSNISMEEAPDYPDNSHIIYIDVENNKIDDKKAEPNSDSELPGSAEGKRNYTIVEPASVNLPRAEIAADMLKQRFGSKYIECECFPRKFILDISEELSEKVITQLAKDSRAIGFIFACLTFVQDCVSKDDSHTTSKFLVYFNMRFNTNVDYVCLGSVFDNISTNIDKIVQKAASYVLESGDAIVHEKQQYVRKVKCPSKTMLENCAKWESDTYRPDLRLLFDKFVRTQNSTATVNDLGFEIVSKAESSCKNLLDITTPEDKFCSVCYAMLENNVPATALVSCGHWFCNCCWREHLMTCVKDGRTTLLCPEFDCDQRVDNGTLLSLLELNHVIHYLLRCHDNGVQELELAKWCPNSACGRVLKVNSLDVKTAFCNCGKRMCFECLNEVHWPANCIDAAAYRQKLLDNRDDKILPVEVVETVVVNGKNCPFCKRFVEKNGGCPYMTCICQNAFCWGCGKAWETKKHGPECYKNGYVNTHGTREFYIEPEDKSMSIRYKRLTRWYKSAQWYKIAVEHRACRQSIKFRDLLNSVNKLASNLTRHVVKAEKRKEPVSFDFQVTDNRSTFEAAKARDFLRNTMDLYAELHQIVEHVAIFLDNSSIEIKSLLPIQNTINKMTMLASFLYDLLLNGHTMDTQYVFRKLKETRYNSTRCIKGLVKYFNQT